MGFGEPKMLTPEEMAQAQNKVDTKNSTESNADNREELNILSDIKIDLAGLVYDLEEKEINDETAKYVIKMFGKKLYQIRETSTDDKVKMMCKEVREVLEKDNDDDEVKKIHTAINIFSYYKI